MNPADKLLEKKEVAGVLHCGLRRVETLIAAGHLAAIKLGPRITRISPQALEEFIERGGARDPEGGA
jgi:excisionase family DNA binding protein